MREICSELAFTGATFAMKTARNWRMIETVSNDTPNIPSNGSARG